MPRRKPRDEEDEDLQKPTSEKGWCNVSFPTPFARSYELAGPARTVQTKSIFSICQVIMEKSNWQEKFRNPEIWKKWKKEVKEQLAPKDSHHHLRWLATGQIPKMDDGDEIGRAGWNYLEQLLEWQASRVDGPITPSAVEGAWIADNIVPAEVKESLLKAVGPLENVPDEAKDWHPGSNQQVLDLVHPSLFCLVYGVTRRVPAGQIALPSLKYMGGGDIVLAPAGVHPPDRKKAKNMYYYGNREPEKDYDTSAKYQWLPSEFDIFADGKVKISSYVNNIHPIKNRDLYFVLENIFEKFVPLFNKVLTDLSGWNPYMFTRLQGEQLYPDVAPEGYDEAPPPEGVNLDEEDSEVSDLMDAEDATIAAELREELREIAEEKGQEPQTVPADFEPITPMDVSDSDSSSSEEAQLSGDEQEEGYPFETPAPNSEIDIRGHRVQVIVKLANIVLTPENPRYSGGAWHVEGMKNECIVATGIYYYESQNISESRLAFRKVIEDPSGAGYDEDGTESARLGHVFGLDNMCPLNETRGSIVTQEDRLICFPNILQHHVDPFELSDPTKAGYRKILVFFLIDPSKRIISTESVPPQQRDWYGDALRRHCPEIARLPEDMLKHIVSNVSGCPMTLEEAKMHRESLMEERKFFINEYDQLIYERNISLCEH